MDEVELYQSADGTVTLDVKTDGDTVWLTQAQMSTLFGRDRTVIVRHIANAEREELAGVRTRAKYAQVQIEGDRSVHRDVEHYNLDVVISVGYRVKSQQGVQFRHWANDVLRRYLVHGVATNEARLREIGAMVQLLERSTDDTVAGIAEVLGRELVNPKMLAAVTLMTAMSRPDEKDSMIRLIGNVIAAS